MTSEDKRKEEKRRRKKKKIPLIKNIIIR